MMIIFLFFATVFPTETEFITVERVSGVRGISCPQTTFQDTTEAVKADFDLTKSPNSGSQWVTGECIDGIGDLQTRYPANEKAVTGFYWQLEDDLNISQPEELTLRYDLKLKANFDFVKGGKLPGLFGGTTSCSGGADAAELGCFSTRLMWRRDGEGELYLYAPQDQADGFCDRPNHICNFEYGNSVGRGVFSFIPGQWHSLEQRVKLNTPGQKNGKFMLFQDGNLVLDIDDINYRAENSIKIMGMMFSTFYGGSDSSWYPSEEQWADFKNFAFDAFSSVKKPSDIDNCAADACHPDASCTTRYNTFTCVCNEGYTGDGSNCTPGDNPTVFPTTEKTTTKAQANSPCLCDINGLLSAVGNDGNEDLTATCKTKKLLAEVWTFNCGGKLTALQVNSSKCQLKKQPTCPGSNTNSGANGNKNCKCSSDAVLSGINKSNNPTIKMKCKKKKGMFDVWQVFCNGVKTNVKVNSSKCKLKRQPKGCSTSGGGSSGVGGVTTENAGHFPNNNCKCKAAFQKKVSAGRLNGSVIKCVEQNLTPSGEVISEKWSVLCPGKKERVFSDKCFKMVVKAAKLC